MKKLEKYSPEYAAESGKIIGLLETALNNPEDQAARRAVIESMEKLGFIEPK
jgi:hypothetical protein